jgi:hypothetical protein
LRIWLALITGSLEFKNQETKKFEVLMSYVVSIWKQNILNTQIPTSYDEADKILSFLKQKNQEEFRTQGDVYQELIEELTVNFPIYDREQGDYHGFWHDGSLLDSRFEVVTSFALSSELSHTELNSAYTSILKHKFIISDSQGGCALLPDGTYLDQMKYPQKILDSQSLLLAGVHKLVTRFLGAK